MLSIGRPSLSSASEAKMAEKGLLSAGDPPSFALAVPGNLRTGPCGPAGPPYGRTEHGRSRGVRHSNSRGGKGVKQQDARDGTPGTEEPPSYRAAPVENPPVITRKPAAPTAPGGNMNRAPRPSMAAARATVGGRCGLHQGGCLTDKQPFPLNFRWIRHLSLPPFRIISCS